jgi:hypothetical protein
LDIIPIIANLEREEISLCGWKEGNGRSGSKLLAASGNSLYDILKEGLTGVGRFLTRIFNGRNAGQPFFHQNRRRG